MVIATNLLSNNGTTMNNIKYKWVLLPLIFFMGNTLEAREYHPHQDIIATAKQLLTESLRDIPDKVITLQPLDRRLAMKKCTQALHAFTPVGTKLIGKTTIGVRCRGDKPWKLFLTATITIYTHVIVANEHISRGQTIQTSNIKRLKKEISYMSRGYFTSMDQVVGKIARYAINMNDVILPTKISRPKLVKRGKEVVIQARAGSIIVKMRGTATADGALGDFIRVKNKRSRRLIQAKVIGDGLVEVTM